MRCAKSSFDIINTCTTNIIPQTRETDALLTHFERSV